MKRLNTLLLLAISVLTVTALAADPLVVSTENEPIAQGPFQPSWQSLEQYRVPEWFRDAKFGIWAHWGVQCQPEEGDWYARNMYAEGNGQYEDHLARYGHPSEVGFKEIIRDWTVEKWDPNRLVALYKRVGAQYFVAMANHHDNFDNWDSPYQPWNSVALGPKKDLVAGWAKAAREQELPFGLTVHAAWARTFYQFSRGADKKGPKASIPYDGILTKDQGEGQWWEGLDPQQLYWQKHPSGSNPKQIYCQQFYDRVADLIEKYQPDLLYFDDNGLPLVPESDAGLKIAADFYNTNLARTGGKDNGVLFGKDLDEQQRKCLTWDVERGVMESGSPVVWQTDTCIGSITIAASTSATAIRVRRLLSICSLTS